MLMGVREREKSKSYTLSITEKDTDCHEIKIT